MKFSKTLQSIMSLIFISLMISCTHTISEAQEADKSKKKIEEVIPITMANLRGHKALHREGFFIIPSFNTTSTITKNFSVERSGRALSSYRKNLSGYYTRYSNELASDIRKSYNGSVKLYNFGTSSSRYLYSKTSQISLNTFDISKTFYKLSWQIFRDGNSNYLKRTEFDRYYLLNTPKETWMTMSGEFKNYFSKTDSSFAKVNDFIGLSWKESMAKGGSEFTKEYEKSGETKNSATGLIKIAWGYIKALGFGLFEPTAKTVAVAGVETTKYAITYPAVSSYILIKNPAIMSVKASFNSFKMGYKLISPTVFSGLSGSIGLATTLSVPVVYATGLTLAGTNKLLLSTSAPAYGIAKSGIMSTYNSARFLTETTFNTGFTAGELTFYQGVSASVLGYSAITAIPTHMFLGSFDTLIFTTWDGPRLLYTSLKGDLAVNK